MEANKIEYDLKAPQTEDVVLPDGEMTDEEKAEFWENEVDIPVIEQNDR